MSEPASCSLLPAPPHALTCELVAGLWEVYAESFPAHEQIPLSELCTRLLLLALDASSEVVGFAATFPLPEGALLLEYLAVRPHARGRGVGSRLLAALLEPGPRPLLIECDLPTTPAHPTFGDPRRRLRFYERLGARLLTTDHVVDLGHGPTRFHLLGIGPTPHAGEEYAALLASHVYPSPRA